MKTTLIKPHVLKFSELKTGQVFLGNDLGIFIKAEGKDLACCLKKIAGLMGEEGKIVSFRPEAVVTLITEAVFTVGFKP